MRLRDSAAKRPALWLGLAVGLWIGQAIGVLGQVRTWKFDANGNWSANANWSPYFSGYSSNTYPNLPATTVFLGSIATGNRTLTLTEGITLGSLTINDDNNYTVTGNTLTFDATGTAPVFLNVAGGGSPTIASAISLADDLTINQDSAGTLTISGAIGGAQDLTKTGTGALTLTGANGLSGAMTISGGTVTFSGASGAATSVTGFTVNSGATLQLDNSVNNNNNRIGNSAGVALAGGTFDFNINTGSGSYSETAGTLTINSGGATVTTDQAASGQTSALTFSSLSRTAGGTVDFSGTGLGTSTRNRILFTSAPTLDDGIIGGWATVGTEWATYGANGVTALTSYDTGAQTGWGTTSNAKPSADQTLTANRTINSLNLTSGIDIAMGTSTRTLTLGTGGLLKSGATASTMSNGRITSGGTELFAHVVSGSTLTISSVIIGTGDSLVKDGAGTLTLSAVNTYTGGTVINEGTLLMSNRRALSSGALTMNGGELEVNWGDGSNNSTISSITITNGTIRRTYTGNTRAAMIAGSGALNVAGPAELIDQGGDGSSGYLRFDGPVNVYDGGTLTLNALTANDEVRFDSATAQNITIAAGGSLVTTGLGVKNFGTTTARNFIGQGTSVADASFLVGDNTTYYSSSTLTINGSGTGGLRVEGTTNNVDSFLTTARVQGLAGSGGTLTIVYTDTNMTNIFAKAPSAGSNVKLGFDAASTNTVVSLGSAVNSLANWNGLVVKGGRVELGWNQSFTGAGVTTLEVSGGILRLAGGNPVGGKTLTVEGDATLTGGVIDGGPGGGSRGKLVVGGNIVTDGTVLWGNPDVTMNPSAGTTTVDGSAPLYGIGVFTKTGGGTVQLNEEITATTVVISQGTLLLGNDNRINDDAAVWLSGGTLATGGYDETVGELSLKADSVIDFGSGSSVLAFDDSSSIPWSANTITVANWSGSTSGGGTDQLIFGSSSSALDPTQVGKIRFVDPYGLPPGTYTAVILPSGEVVPIPEPATVAAVLMLAGGLAYRERRQLGRGCRAMARWLRRA